MTPEQLDALERLAEAATPGPWEPGDGRNDAAWIVRYGGGPICSTEMPGAPTAEQPANVKFIAASRTAVPALCAALRSERNELADAVAQLAVEREDHAKTSESLRAERARTERLVGLLDEARPLLAALADADFSEFDDEDDQGSVRALMRDIKAELSALAKGGE